MTTPRVTALPGALRQAELERLLLSLRMRPRDLAATLGVHVDTVRLYRTGRAPVPNPVLLALTAIERLPAIERETLIVRPMRAPRGVL
jgi:DNA-binding transcriptional regulator YiaG